MCYAGIFSKSYLRGKNYSSNTVTLCRCPDSNTYFTLRYHETIDKHFQILGICGHDNIDCNMLCGLFQKTNPSVVLCTVSSYFLDAAVDSFVPHLLPSSI